MKPPTSLTLHISFNVIIHFLEIVTTKSNYYVVKLSDGANLAWRKLLNSYCSGFKNKYQLALCRKL